MKAVVPKTNLKLLTLTIRTTNLTLAASLKKLYVGFRRLRQRQFWKERVRGGLAICEVKYDVKNSRWHPHLHVLLDAEYMPQSELSQQWLRVTGDSPIVDIRLVKRSDVAIGYVTKYLTKLVDPETYANHDRLCEAMNALKSRRLLIPFGEWKDARLLASPQAFHAVRYAHVDELRYRSLDGDQTASMLLAALRPFKPSESHYVLVAANGTCTELQDASLAIATPNQPRTPT